jgi:hypothetical protein
MARGVMLTGLVNLNRVVAWCVHGISKWLLDMLASRHHRY